MNYRPLRTDADPDPVRHVTFVPFLPNGECAVMAGGGSLALPAGEVRQGEHWLFNTSLRVPLETAGLLRQRVGPFAADGEHLYAWIGA